MQVLQSFKSCRCKGTALGLMGICPSTDAFSNITSKANDPGLLRMMKMTKDVSDERKRKKEGPLLG